MTDLTALLERDLAEAERKAWDSLARWKFWMFGYHAADVVKIKRRLGRSREPMFKDLVEAARKVMAQRYGVAIGAGDHYLIWSNVHSGWWRPNGCGYTGNLDEAGRYSRDQAIEQCAYGRDGYTVGWVPSEMPIRLSAAMQFWPAKSPREMILADDHNRCTWLDRARKARAA